MLDRDGARRMKPCQLPAMKGQEVCRRKNPFWMDDGGSESLRSVWPEKNW